MAERQSPERVIIDGWTFRVSQAEFDVQPQRILLLLHGYLGNENAMWILTNPISRSYTMLAPRAPVRMGPDQFSWHAIDSQWPDLTTYQDLGEQVFKRVDDWAVANDQIVDKIDVMGFSQGAVLAYSLCLNFPERLNKVAALAGFIPSPWQKLEPDPKLAHIEFFIAHGTRDDVVPISKAREASSWLAQHGASVTACEAETGHKLSANCFSGLGRFFD